MEEHEGAQRAAIQRTRHAIRMTQEAADLNRRLTRSVKAGQADIALLPDDVLRDYEASYREESESAAELADTIRAQADSR